MAKIVEPNASELCEECKNKNVSRNAAKVIYAEVGDVEKRRIPLCKEHYEELRKAMQQLDDLLDRRS